VTKAAYQVQALLDQQLREVLENLAKSEGGDSVLILGAAHKKGVGDRGNGDPASRIMNRKIALRKPLIKFHDGCVGLAL
jgi:UDP-N-acetyl-D-mannosaminuronate dehydrogenase